MVDQMIYKIINNIAYAICFEDILLRDKNKALKDISLHNVLNCVVLNKHYVSNAAKEPVSKPRLLRQTETCMTHSVY